jgi:hypothetical protein
MIFVRDMNDRPELRNEKGRANVWIWVELAASDPVSPF